MEYVARGIYISDRITCKDILSVYFLGGYASKEKKLFRRIHFLKRIVGILTTVKHPRIWHVYKLNKILKIANLTGKKDDSVKSDKTPLESMNESIDLISSEIGKTQNEILENCTPDELSRLHISSIRQKEINNIELEKMLLRTAPAANASADYISSRLNYLDNRIEEIQSGKAFKKIEGKKEPCKVFQFEFKQ